MAELPLRLPVQSVVGRDGQVANARVINAYVEQVERDGKASYALYGVPGLTRWDTGTYSGYERGMVQFHDNYILAILGSKVVRFDSGGNNLLVGSILGAGRATMAVDREAPTKTVAIVTQEGQYYLVTSGTTLALQTISNLPTPNSVTYLAGRFIFGIPDGRIFCSSVDDGATVNAAGFDTANLLADNLVRVYAYSGYLYACGKNHIEIYVPDPALANYPFPYSNTRQTIPYGLMAAYSIAELDGGLVWVDNFGNVRYGTSAQRISTDTVERAISKLTPLQQSNLNGFAISWEGNKCYVLNSGIWTWIYDSSTQTWVERKSYGSSAWRVSNAVLFTSSSKLICGDSKSGGLYFLDIDNFLEAGNIIEMEIWCGHLSRFPGDWIVDRLSVDVVAGIGLQTGNLSNTDPKLIIDYSDDGGKNFQGETSASLGAIGVYDATVETRGWGLVRQKGRIWRFRATVQALKAIIQASIDARAVRPSQNAAIMSQQQ